MNRTNRTNVGLARRLLPLVMAIAWPGCYDAKLPESLKVKLPEVNSLVAPIDTGPPPLANSTWAMYGRPEAGPDGEAAAPGPEPLIRIAFGPDGEIVRVFDNREFGPEHIGEVVIADALIHPAPFPGSSYVAESYGGVMGPDLGVTAMGKFFIGPVEAAVAEVYVFGTLDADEDHFEGTLGYEIVVNPALSDVLAGVVHSRTSERDVYAVRE